MVEPGADDPGMVRAGAAAAARRRELNVSQRSLAAEGVINAGALIAFEKGRSWPRAGTRAKLEEILQWPAGAIERLRRGEPAEVRTERRSGPEDIPLIAQAVTAAANTFGSTISSLPPAEHPEFVPRATAILSDLRQLEAVAARAARIQVTPGLIRALGTVRNLVDELTLCAASVPGATLGQRLYATRRRANLTIAETAQAAGVSEDVVTRVESEESVPAGAAAAVDELIAAIDWR